MLKKEFEYYAGYEVSNEDYYNIIEPMYMATKLDKQEFVQTLNKERFAEPTASDMVKKMKALAKRYAETYNEDWVKANEIANELNDLCHKYGERFFHIGTDPHNEWCFIQKSTFDWTGEISRVVFEVGRLGFNQARATIDLYKHK